MLPLWVAASSLKTSSKLFGFRYITNHHVLRPPHPVTSANFIPFDECDNERHKQLLFELYRNPQTDRISVAGFLKELRDSGLREDDPRLSTIITNLRNHEVKRAMEHGDIELSREKFVSTLDDRTHVIKKALKNQMIIPNWKGFVEEIAVLFEESRVYEDGQLATYIPQLARADPSAWGVSVCTIDGQQASWGHHASPFCLQSVSKPFTYAMVVNEIGEQRVHSFVGMEASGKLFNEICLDPECKFSIEVLFVMTKFQLNLITPW